MAPMKTGRKVQGIVYYQNGTAIHILCLHRTALEGGFWQPLTGTVEDGESYEECLVRELGEETGIHNGHIVHIRGPLKTFKWSRDDVEYEEHVYAVQVPPETQISLSTEHDACQWLAPNSAKEMFTFQEVRDGVDILQEKLAAQQRVLTSVIQTLETELGWTLDPSSLRSVFEGFANYVFFFEYENERYYVKYFPEVFREKESVAKPAGSFERECLVYEGAQRNGSGSTPELVRRLVTEPILITKAWGSALNANALDSMTISQIVDHTCLILKNANSFRSFLSKLDLKGSLAEFSRQQEQYLIYDPLRRLEVSPQAFESFISEYSTLGTEVLIGDLSLKNILIEGTQVRFCDFESIFVAPPLFDTCYFIADLLSKLALSKRSQLLKELYSVLEKELTQKERTLFFPLMAVCMSYRSANSLKTEAGLNLELGFLHSIFNAKPL